MLLYALNCKYQLVSFKNIKFKGNLMLPAVTEKADDHCGKQQWMPFMFWKETVCIVKALYVIMS